MSVLINTIVRQTHSWALNAKPGAIGRVPLRRLPIPESDWRTLATALADDAMIEEREISIKGRSAVLRFHRDAKALIAFALHRTPTEIESWPRGIVMNQDFAVRLRDERSEEDGAISNAPLLLLIDREMDSLQTTSEDLTARDRHFDPSRLIQALAPGDDSTARSIIGALKGDIITAVQTPTGAARLNAALEKWALAPPRPEQIAVDLLGYFQDDDLPSMVRSGNARGVEDRLRRNRQLTARAQDLVAREADAGEWEDEFPGLKKSQLDRLARGGPINIALDEASKRPTRNKLLDFKLVRAGTEVRSYIQGKKVANIVAGRAAPVSVNLNFAEAFGANLYQLFIDGEEVPPEAIGNYVTVSTTQVKMRLDGPEKTRHSVLKVYLNKPTTRGKATHRVNILQLDSHTPTPLLSEFVVGGVGEPWIQLDVTAGQVIQTAASRATRNQPAGAVFDAESTHVLPVEIQAGNDEPTEWSFEDADGVFTLPLACQAQDETPSAQKFRGALLEPGPHASGLWHLEPEGRSIRTEDGQVQKRLAPEVQDDLRRENRWVAEKWVTPEVNNAGVMENRDPPASVENEPGFRTIVESYEALYAWLDENDSLPTLVGANQGGYWERVRDVLQAISEYAVASQTRDRARLSWIASLGCERDRNGNVSRTTPMWPPALALAAHVAQLQVEQGLLVTEELAEHLTPSGSVPLNIVHPDLPQYAMADSRGTWLWLDWVSLDADRDKAYPMLGKIMRERANQFIRSFPQLCAAEVPSPLRIRVVRALPDTRFIQHLEAFLEKALDTGSWTEDHRLDLEFVLRTPEARNALDDRMEAANEKVHPSYGVDLVHQLVRVRKVPVNFLEMPPSDWERYAHISIVAGQTQYYSEARSASSLSATAVIHGLVPSYKMDLTAKSADEPSAYGPGNGGAESADWHEEFGRLWNQILATVAHRRPLRQGDDFAVPAVIPEASLEHASVNLGAESLWVVYLEPGVGLVPLTNGWISSAEKAPPVLVHFTTTSDPTSPGYSDVTITERVNDLGRALKTIAEPLGFENSDDLLPVLNSLNGEWLLMLVQGLARDDEKNAILATAVTGHKVLKKLWAEHPDLVWLAAGWEDYYVVTGAAGKTKKSAGMKGKGSGTDDILIVGIDPNNPASIHVRFAESKFGTSPVGKGIEQVRKTAEELLETLGPSTLAGKLARSKFGHYVLRAAERMAVHDLLPDGHRDWLHENQDVLRSGEFGLADPTTIDLPAAGFVFHVDPLATITEEKPHGDVIEIRTPHIVPKLARASARRPRANAAVEIAVSDGRGNNRQNFEVEESAAPNGPPFMGDEPDVRIEDAAPAAVEEADLAAVTLAEAIAEEPPGWRGGILHRLTVPPIPGPQAPAREVLLIDQILQEFKIDVEPPEPNDVVAGPQATVVHLKLGAGTTVPKLRNILESLQVRMNTTQKLSLSTTEKPGHVSLFIPQPNRVPIPLSCFLESADRGAMRIPIPAGLTSTNEMLWVDLQDTNHLLIAGATGSGKTVYLRGILLSLMVNFEPDELRIHVIDPKQLDFARFKQAPHMTDPPVVGVADALDLMNWLLAEIARRRELLAEEGVSNLFEYNEENSGAKLPVQLLLIDEYNQLRLSADEDQAKELEDHICQLAQIGRAYGVYLIVATQRPSVQVITGDIKANFPTRMSFRVASGTDSRVILDEEGAERLLPHGDGLFTDPSGRLIRFQALLTDQKMVKSILQEIRKQADIDPAAGP